MKKYKITNVKAQNILGESVTTLPKNLTFKTKKNMSLRSVFNKASKYLFENYNVLLEEADIDAEEEMTEDYFEGEQPIIELVQRYRNDPDSLYFGLMESAKRYASPYAKSHARLGNAIAFFVTMWLNNGVGNETETVESLFSRDFDNFIANLSCYGSIEEAESDYGESIDEIRNQAYVMDLAEEWPGSPSFVSGQGLDPIMVSE